ncbi:insulin-like growth factor 2a precursor [Danio rerio]|uniref:Insulin-like growth factor 2 n=1 Tax=Danio rerio TaxID=7955 RepID=Q9PUD0_DANRE|nr:insulin-like growth factor 2a precursor [Danio rerio]AAF07193.1 insulin-like growth factor 2 precursor [Danio rerio]|eukprot:NP_571508.1 insulin-like growth factor 2a precursor [Danio rerio]
MDDYHVFCASCRKTEETRTTMRSLIVFVLSLSMLISNVTAGETLCGGELVDTLQFVCGEDGFYISRPNRSNSRRPQRGIVEECCFRSCELHLLQQYCAKPVKSERDVSSTSLQVFPVSQALHKDTINVKYSKYEVWQQKAAQRLRRGVPSILLARKFRRQMEKIQDEEQTSFHRPLMTLPNRQPAIVPHVQISTSRK